MAIRCTILSSGDLKVTADNESRSGIAQWQRDGRSYWTIMADLFEPFFTNGSYCPFDAGDGNPFVGLTSAPCIAEDLTVEDNGDRTIEGRFWYFPNYCLENDLDTLKTKGAVVYTFGGEN